MSFFQLRSPRIYNPLGTPPPASGDLNISVSDSITVTESAIVSISVSGTLTVSVSDSITLTESVQRLEESYINKSESITVTESVGRLLNSNVSVSDNVTLTESVGRLLESNINKSESITVTESVTVQPPQLNISVSDSITLTESVARRLESFVNKSESITVTDTSSVSMPNEIVDQSQLLNGTGAGFGENAHVRYRGQGFTPTLNNLSAIEFQRAKGSKGIKIYIDTADANSFPTHAVGSELYSFTVTNASITGSFQKFTLPTLLTGLTIGAQYVFYIAPWDTGTDLYADDYQDMQFRNANVYAGGKAIVWDVDGANTWAVSDAGNLDLYFNTYGYAGAVADLSISVHDNITVTERLTVTAPRDANTLAVVVVDNITVTDTPHTRVTGALPLYFDGPSYNALIEQGDSSQPQIKKPGMGSTLYFGDGVKMGFAIKQNTTGTSGDVGFADSTFSSAVATTRNGRISITGTGSLVGTSLSWEHYLAGEPEGDTFYVVMSLTNNSGVSKNYVPTLILPDVNLQNFRWVDVGNADTDVISWDATNKYLQLTTPAMSNIFVGLKACNTNIGYKAKTGYSDVSGDLAAGDLDNTIGTLGNTNYIWIENGSTASPTTIAAGATATFAWVVAYRTTQAALQTFMAAKTSAPTSSLTTEAAYYTNSRLAISLPFDDPIAQVYDMNSGRLNAMAHSQLINSKKYVPAGSYTFTFAFGRDGYYGNKVMLQALNGKSVTSDEIALFKVFENTGTHEQMHEVAAYTNASGYYETAGDNGTPGDQDAYLILKGYEYYVATKDDAWLATNITYLNNVGTYLYNYWVANKDASDQFAGHGTSTYLDGAGNITGVNPMIDPVLDSLVAYTFARLAELNTHLGGSYLTTAASLNVAYSAIVAGFSSLWNSGASWPYFNKKTDGTTYSNRHIAKVDAALWSILDGTKSATMATQLIDTTDWYDDPQKNFHEVPTTDSLYDANSYWYDGGWHLTDFKAIETALRYGTNAQAQAAWVIAKDIANDRLTNLQGFLGEKSVNSGTFAFSIGALHEMLVRGLFGIDAHATYFTITPNLTKLGLGGSWTLTTLRLGGWTYNITVVDNSGVAAITINGASYSSGATIYYDPNVSDAITVTESVNVSIPLTISVSDSIAVTESVQRTLVSDINKSETITLTESVNRLLESNINKSDSITVSESLQRMLESNVSTSDSITVTESIQRMLESFIAKSESITVSEAATVLLPFLNLNVSDSITVTESLQRVLESFISKSESITVSEAITLLAEANINTGDTVTVTEALQRMLESYINVSDSISVSENVAVSIAGVSGLQINVSDSITVTESVRSELNSFITKSESITVSENSKVELNSFVSVSDSITVSEALQRVLESNVNKSESITVSEATTVFIPTLTITTSDSIVVTEAITVSRVNANDLNIGVADTITTTDAVQASEGITISTSDTVRTFDDVGEPLNQNGDFSSQPAFVAAQTATNWIDGTAAGSSTNTYHWHAALVGANTTARFDTDVPPGKVGGSLKLHLGTLGTYIEARNDTQAYFTTGQPLKLSPDTVYKISFWIKAQNVTGSAGGAQLAFLTSDAAGNSAGEAAIGGVNIAANQGWTYYEANFTTSSTANTGHVEARVYGHNGLATLLGDFWFGDIRVQRLTGGDVVVESFISKSDTVTVSEAVTVRSELYINKSETVTVSESTVALLPTLNVTVSDTITVTETVATVVQGASNANLLTLLGAG
jgi:Na+-transporting NADH:ubiquinone oxidoreductase subunit NqrE